MPCAAIRYAILRCGEESGIIVSITGEPDPTELEKHGIRGMGLSGASRRKDLEEMSKLIDARKITANRVGGHAPGRCR